MTAFRFPFIFALFLALFCFAPALRAAEEAKPLQQADILGYLEQIIAWQREVVALEPLAHSPLQVLLKDNIRRNASDSVVYAFEFAKAEAEVLQNTSSGPQIQAEGAQNVLKISAEVDAQIDRVHQELAELNVRARNAKPAQRNEITIRREQLNGELKLATARQEVLKSVIGLFSSTNGNDAGSLADKISNLSHTIPEITEKPKSADTTPKVKAVIVPAAENTDKEKEIISDGIFNLSTNLLNLYRKKREVYALWMATHQLQDLTQSLIDSQRLSMQAMTQQGNEIVQGLGTQPDIAIAAQRKTLDTLIGNYKQLSTAILPMGQVNLLLTATGRNIDEWDNSIDAELTRTIRAITWRVGIIGFIIFLLLALSELGHRATVKYVHDRRRQRQLRLTRRAVIAFLIVMIIAMNFADFGSFATYAGLLTAGLAVALQNIILSMVAYFFLFGRFGVRVGDRLTISGVTGEVIQVGLVRLYLMELGGSFSELHPTGKIVAFPNSIVFQPSAFIKHIPGANYDWKEITFILDAEVDYQIANNKLTEAVDIAYKEYQDIMEVQQSALTNATHLDVTIPPPKGFLHYTESGLEFVIRYPVDIAHENEINQRITRQLHAAIEREPGLKMASSQPPKIKTIPDSMV